MVEYFEESDATNDAMTEESGNVLRENNEKIVRLMSLLRKQRDEMNFLIDKQETEKGRIQNEIEKLSFKLTLLTKSLGQRVHARTNYDKTINEIEGKYHSLVNESGKLLMHISKDYKELEEIMDKKTGTGASIQEKKEKPPVKVEKPEPPLEEIPSEPKISSPTPESTNKDVSGPPGVEGYDLADSEYPFETLEEEIDLPSKPESEDNSRRSSNTTEVTVTKVAKRINEEKRMSHAKTEERKQGTASPEKEGNKSGSRRNSKSAEEQAQEKDRQKNWKSISDSESMSRSHEGSMTRNRSASQNQESDDSDDEGGSQGSKERRRTLDSFSKAKRKVDDEEVQSFREAYGRQHTHPQVPSRSPSGFRKSERKRSTD